MLIRSYVETGYLAAAQQVADEAPHRLPIQRLQLLMHEGDWRQAAQVTYDALNDLTMQPLTEAWGEFSIRMDARQRGDYPQARATLEGLCGVTWSASGIPTLPTQLGLATPCVMLADVLIASGDRAHGERLLRASLADMNYIIHDLKRGDLWYINDQALALILLGDRKGGLAALREMVANGQLYGMMWPVELDPAIAALRGDPQFEAIFRAIKQTYLRERQRLDQLRATGKVPRRPPPAATAGWAAH
jgi:hypothetical protein